MKNDISASIPTLSLLASLAIASTAIVAKAAPPEKDREAILAMAGEYEVTFTFEETVPLQSEYELKKPYEEDAHELVVVVEDTPEQIALQHLLVVAGGKKVVKHWRQVWTWQDTRIVDFQGRSKWKVREVAPEDVAGTWSQLVTQTDDSPRYESYGKWNHDGGYSRWESAVTARPLPRREHTKRDDYQVLLATNRHALTPTGWVHGQDNLKLIVSEKGEKEGYIARERGLNTYDLTEEMDFTAAREYWEKTGKYWAVVAEAWADVEAEKGAFEIVKEIEGDSLSEEIYAWADTVSEDGKIPAKSEVREVIESYLK